MAISSIHIEAGKEGYLGHNDRSSETVNSIFSKRNNEVWNNKKEAFSIYRKELSKRAKAYTKHTNQKLQNKSITHLSAMVNLNSHHKMKDLNKVKSILERELGTKVFQIVIHHDEGHIDDEGKEVINHHAHLEFMGLDQEGRSVRRKLTKRSLSDLQSDVAMVLKMERGKNYAQAREPRPKRLDTYDFKQHKKLEQANRQKLAANQKKELLAKEKKHLAKIKDINLENTRLRKLLQENKASRQDYATLEAVIKELKTKVRSKTLEHDEMLLQLAEVENNVIILLEVNQDWQKENIKLSTHLSETKELLSDERLKSKVNPNLELEQELLSVSELYRKSEIALDKANKLIEKLKSTQIIPQYKKSNPPKPPSGGMSP